MQGFGRRDKDKETEEESEAKRTETKEAETKTAPILKESAAKLKYQNVLGWSPQMLLCERSH